VPAWESAGFALWQLDRKSEALAALQAALARAPERELTLTYLAVLAATLGRREEAIAYWQRALAVNPWCSQYHYRLASLLAERQQWQSALEEDQAAIALNPAALEMRLLLIACLFRTGKEDQARVEFNTISAAWPGERERLLRWYRELKTN
jgi:tetratricopeptide (TPR) repeat protein